jgi:hypothetical protein
VWPIFSGFGIFPALVACQTLVGLFNRYLAPTSLDVRNLSSMSLLFIQRPPFSFLTNTQTTPRGHFQIISPHEVTIQKNISL